MPRPDPQNRKTPNRERQRLVARPTERRRLGNVLTVILDHELVAFSKDLQVVASGIESPRRLVGINDDSALIFAEPVGQEFRISFAVLNGLRKA